MAMAVLQLHECRLVHSKLSLKFFKVCAALPVSLALLTPPQIFPIDEPPCHTNLRVKLISMKHARDFTPELAQADIFQLGLSMCAVALGQQFASTSSNEGDVERYLALHRAALKSYDVSLTLLIDWMLELDGAKRASIADVIRHPFFMGVNETEAFALALFGNLFTGLVANKDFDIELKDLKTELESEIGRVFGLLRVDGSSDDGSDGSSDESEDLDLSPFSIFRPDGDGFFSDDEVDCDDGKKKFADIAVKFLSDNGHVSEADSVPLAAMCDGNARVHIRAEYEQLIPEEQRRAKGYFKTFFETFHSMFGLHVKNGALYVYALKGDVVRQPGGGGGWPAVGGRGGGLFVVGGGGGGLSAGGGLGGGKAAAAAEPQVDLNALADEAHKILAAEGRKIDLAVAGNRTFKLWKVLSALPERDRKQKNWLKNFFSEFPDKFELAYDLSGCPHVCARK
jgi:hypothetical protein